MTPAIIITYHAVGNLFLIPFTVQCELVHDDKENAFFLGLLWVAKYWKWIDMDLGAQCRHTRCCILKEVIHVAFCNSCNKSSVRHSLIILLVLSLCNFYKLHSQWSERVCNLKEQKLDHDSQCCNILKHYKQKPNYQCMRCSISLEKELQHRWFWKILQQLLCEHLNFAIKSNIFRSFKFIGNNYILCWSQQDLSKKKLLKSHWSSAW